MLKSVYAFGLSVCTRSNSRKYSSNVLNFLYVIQISNSVYRIENGIHGTNGSSTETHKIFRYIMVYGGGNLKRILTYLSYTKHKEIHICHSDIQKDNSYKKSYK